MKKLTGHDDSSFVCYFMLLANVMFRHTFFSEAEIQKIQKRKNFYQKIQTNQYLSTAFFQSELFYLVNLVFISILALTDKFETFIQ